MNNFEFSSPTRILFGKGAIGKTGAAAKACGARKVLLHYGGSASVKTGALAQTKASLDAAGISYVLLGGAQPNPRLSLVYEGIDLCKSEGVDFIIAVGGGSAIDSAKAIAVGATMEGDVWELFEQPIAVPSALPLGVVLTIPAAGSEASSSCVITKGDQKRKRAIGSELIRPRFAALNPVVTFSLPRSQTLYGASDIMAHIMERYFTNVEHTDLTDRLCEAALRTMIRNLPIVLEEPDNYDARAEIMWTGTLAHNDLLSTGRVGDWASHLIEHELSGEYDVAHGAGLSVVFPAWMKYVYKQRLPQFIRFAMRVWDAEYDNDCPERTALEGILRMEAFYKRCGMPVRLNEIGIGEEKLRQMAENVKFTDGLVGNFVKLNSEDVYNIYKLAL